MSDETEEKSAQEELAEKELEKLEKDEIEKEVRHEIAEQQEEGEQWKKIFALQTTVDTMQSQIAEILIRLQSKPITETAEESPTETTTVATSETTIVQAEKPVDAEGVAHVRIRRRVL